jgi:hypothetical protein
MNNRRTKWDNWNRERKKQKTDYLTELRAAGDVRIRARQTKSWSNYSASIAARRKQRLIQKFIEEVIEEAIYCSRELSIHFKASYTDFLQVHGLDSNDETKRDFDQIERLMLEDLRKLCAAVEKSEYSVGYDHSGEPLETLNFSVPATQCQVYTERGERLA